MDHDESANGWPSGAGIGGEFGETWLNFGFVGLVLKLVNAAAVAAVVSGHARKQHHCTAVWTMRPVERLGYRQRFRRKSDPVIAGSRSLHHIIVYNPTSSIGSTQRVAITTDRDHNFRLAVHLDEGRGEGELYRQ